MWNEHAIKKEIWEWVEEYTLKSPEWVKKRRMEYLVNEYCDKGAKMIQLSEINSPDWFEPLIKGYIRALRKQMEKIRKEIIFYISDEAPEIDEAMIERAREYPIEDLIEVNNRGFAICPFHEDKNPSAYCKNNYLYCFSCNTQADTIKLFMHIYNADFKEAVKKLS